MHEVGLAGMLVSLLWRRGVDSVPDVAEHWAPQAAWIAILESTTNLDIGRGIGLV
jgi:hypothetical protein